MTRRPGTVVLDSEAVDALADAHHPKHAAALAVLEVANQRGARGERVRVAVPVAVRIETRWDRTTPAAAGLNHLSRAKDATLDAAGANRCARLRSLIASASVVDATVAHAAETAAYPPVTIATSDARDFARLASHLLRPVTIAVL